MARKDSSTSTPPSASDSRSLAQERGGEASKRKGQRVSLERGRATHHKKNPGKRPTQGGS